MKKPLFYQYKENIINYYKDLDFWYKTYNRPKGFCVFQNKKVVVRNIYGKFKIPITRYIYFNENKEKISTYINEQINEIRDLSMIDSFIDNATKQNNCSYKELASLINFAYCKSSIFNKIHVKNQEKINSLSINNSIKYKPISNIFYIEIDDSFQKIWDEKHKKIMTRNRLLMIHQGKKDNKIINKTMILETKKTKEKGKNIDQLSSLIFEKINLIYGVKNPKIIVISDGARWMKSLAKKLKANHVLDKFHLIRILKKTIGYGFYSTKNQKILKFYNKKFKQSIYQILKQKLQNSQIEDSILILNQLINELTNELPLSKINEIKSLIRYLKSNKNLIESYSKNWYIGSRTECFISHFIKKKTTKKFGLIGWKRFKFLILNQQNKNLKIILI